MINLFSKGDAATVVGLWNVLVTSQNQRATLNLYPTTCAYVDGLVAFIT